MTVTSPARRPPVKSRRAGYAVAAAVNAAMWYLVNTWPGWQTLPFLTEDTSEVLGLLNASLVVAIVANVVYLAYDPTWVTSLGGMVTTGVGLAVLARFWQVFPFDFGGASVDWELIARIGLVAAMVGAAIGLVVQFVTLVRVLRPGLT